MARTPTVVQTLLFPIASWDVAGACAWAKAHGWECAKSHVTENYIRIRQVPPEHFARGSFRTIAFGARGIKAVVGHLRRG